MANKKEEMFEEYLLKNFACCTSKLSKIKPN